MPFDNTRKQKPHDDGKCASNHHSHQRSPTNVECFSLCTPEKVDEMNFPHGALRIIGESRTGRLYSGVTASPTRNLLWFASFCSLQPQPIACVTITAR